MQFHSILVKKKMPRCGILPSFETIDTKNTIHIRVLAAATILHHQSEFLPPGLKSPGIWVNITVEALGSFPEPQ
jgi:hypothetical protein